MAVKEKAKKYYHKKSVRVTAEIMVVVFFLTMVLQSATMVAINRSEDKTKAAVNYLAQNTEYVNKNRTQRVVDYLQTLGPRETLEDYYKLAGTQIAREEYADALVNIEKCIALYNNEDHEIYFDLLSKRGCLLVMLGRYDAALQSLDLALKKNPGAANVYLVKAQIYSERQDTDNLIKSLTAYLRLVPEDSSIRALLAQAQFSEGEYAAAAQQYKEILKTDPNAEIEYLYGLNAVRNSDFVAGEASLTKAIEKDDKFDSIYYYRGVCRMSLGDYQGAVADLTESIEREDMIQASYYTRGVCLIMNNENKKGLADLIIAANRSDDPEVTKQAWQLLAELKAAQEEAARTGSETQMSAETAQAAVETVQPQIALPSEQSSDQ